MNAVGSDRRPQCNMRRVGSRLALIVALVTVAAALVPAGTRAQLNEHVASDATLVIRGDGDGRLGAIAVADFDGDGAPDLAFGASLFDAGGTDNGKISIVRGPVAPPGVRGTVSLERVAVTQIIGANQSRTGRRIAAGDVTGDGLADLLWLDGEGDAVFFVAGGQALVDPVIEPKRYRILARPDAKAFDLAVGDVDGDGAADVVYGSPEAEQVVIRYGPFTTRPDGTAHGTRTAILQGEGGSGLGFAVAVGDLTGDGQADLAVNLIGEFGADSIAVVSGPIRAATTLFDALGAAVVSEGPLGIAAITIGDADLDGRNDLLIGRAGRDEVRLIPGRVLGPARFPDEDLLTTDVYVGDLLTLLGVGSAVGDYDGDGVNDVLVAAAFDGDGGTVVAFAARHRGPAIHAILPGEVPAGSTATLEIVGQGLINPTVLFRDVDGNEMEVSAGEADSTEQGDDVAPGRARVPLPDGLVPGPVEVTVRTAIGDATLEEAFVVRPGTRAIPLTLGWNLVGITADTAVENAIEALGPNATALFTWNASEGVFRSFVADAPAFLNDLTHLEGGGAVWVYASAAGAWEQPSTLRPRTISLETGANFAAWTGPDATPVAQAVAGISDVLRAALVWDAQRQVFLRYEPDAPAQLNDPITLDFGDGLWLDLVRPIDWNQPGSRVQPTLAEDARLVRDAVVFVDQGRGSGSGFVISGTEILTNAHVVGSAPTVTVRFVNGEERRGYVRAVDGPLDIAVIQVVDLPVEVRRLDWESAEQPLSLTPVFAWGFPGGELFGESTAATVTAGIVSAIQLDEVNAEEFSVVQIDAALNPGNSGGPVVINDGRVIGISDFKVLLRGSAAEGLSFAIDVTAHRDRIRSLLTR